MDMTTAGPSSLPVACPVFVGRSTRLAEIVHLAERAACSQGQIALVSGDAGIGKSRLLAEAKALLTGETADSSPGFLVLEGRCFEEDRQLPYAPFLDMLRRYAVSLSAGSAELAGSTSSDVARLQSDLKGVATFPPAGAALDPLQEKRRLQDSLLSFLTGFGPYGPLLVMVEDVHWADDASLEFLQYLTRQLAELPVLLLLTHRDEVGPDLAHFLAALERTRLAHRLPLRPLPLPDVEAMIQATFGLRQPVAPDFLQAVYAFTEGNPFFIEETLRSLLASGDIFFADGQWDRKPLGELHIPRAARVAVQQRLRLLSDPTRRLLELASVAGRHFDVAVLLEASGQDETTLIAAFKEMIAAQLVVEDTADLFSFRHALTQQAVLSSMLARERRTLHGLLAQTMERLQAEDGHSYAADLTYHFEQAGDWRKVLTYAPQAGEQDLRVYALRAAIDRFTLALDAARRLAVPPPPAVLLRRGQAHAIAAHFAEALADLEAGLEGARAAEDRVAEWQGLADLGDLWLMRDSERAGQYLRQARDLARTLDDPALLAASLSQLGSWHMNGERPFEARGCHQEALSILEALGDQHATAAALHCLGETYLHTGEQQEGIPCMVRAAGMMRALGDRLGYAYSLMYSGDRGPTYMNTVSPWIQVDLAELVDDIEEASRISREIGWRAGEALGTMFLAFSLGPHGEYVRALDAAERGRTIANDIDHGPMRIASLYALCSLHVDLLDAAPARALIEEDRSLVSRQGLVFATRYIAAVYASACIMLDDLPAAQRELDSVSGPELPFTTLAQRHLWCARAELELARQQPAESLRIVDLLIGSVDGRPAAATVTPRLWILRGQALAALGRLAEATSDLQAAAATALAHSARPFVWRAQAALAHVYRQQGIGNEAERAEAAARAVIEDLAQGLTSDERQAAFRSAALGQLPRRAPLTPRRIAKLRFGGLTEREREVAALLRRGLSNRAVADELVLSERTVERHVANIMAKLDVHSRSQIAVWAAEHGITLSRR